MRSAMRVYKSDVKFTTVVVTHHQLRNVHKISILRYTYEDVDDVGLDLTIRFYICVAREGESTGLSG